MAAPVPADLSSALLSALGPFFATLQAQNTASAQAPALALPSSQAPAPPSPVSAPPILSRYTRTGSALPLATQGHPNFGNSAPRASLPGFNTTLSGYASGTVAAQPRYPRPSSAHRETPSSSSQLVQRQPRKRRGTAVHPPGIVSNPQAAAISSVYRQNMITHEMTDMAIRNIVVTPTSTPNIALPQQLWSQYVECSESFDLVHDMILDKNTTLGDVHTRTLDALQHGPAAWRLGGLSTAFARVLRSASVPLLQLLRLNNKGTPRSDGSVMMGRLSLDSELTLAQLVTERVQEFAKPGRTIRDKHLVIFWIMTNTNVSCIASIDGGARRRHTCAPALMHAMFGPETSLGVPQDWDNAPECESGGETDDEGEVADDLMDFDFENLPATPTWEPRETVNESQSTSANLTTAGSSRAPITPVSTPAAPATVPAFLTRLPPILRGYGKPFSQWTPPAGSFSSVHLEIDLAAGAYKAASEGSDHNLLVEGKDMDEMVQSLTDQLETCARTGENNLAMAALRSFCKFKILPATGSRHIVSEGTALEREVIFTAWQQYTREHAGQFLLPRADEYCSIATTPALQHTSFISPKRRRDLYVFGMLTAQMVLHNMSIAPLIPALILMMTYGFDMRCLTREFISEWHSELAEHVAGVIAGGKDGDLSPYQSTILTYFGDCQPAQFRDRTETQNLGLASDILYRGTMGPALPGNPELKAFYDGFDSACSNGFSMTELLRSAPGGVPLFLSRLYATTIISSTDFMQSTSVTGPARAAALALCSPTNVLRGKALRGIITEFLGRTGVPIQAELDSLVSTGTLSPLANLTEIDHAAYRSRIACHAICGNPHLPAGDELEQIKIYFVLPDDHSYRAYVRDPVFSYRHGNILFRACFRSAYIPLGFLFELAEHTYPALDADGNPTAPHSLEQAIDNWLLLQFLNGIGGHSIM